VDGVWAPLSLIESKFPTIEAMRDGLGTIRMKLHAAPFGAGAAPGPRAARIALGPFWAAAIGMLLVARLAVLMYRAKHDKRAVQILTS